MEEDCENDQVYTPQSVLTTFIDSQDGDILLQCVNCVTDSLETCDEDFIHKHVLPGLITLMKSDFEGVTDAMTQELCNFAEVLMELFPDIANGILVETVLPIITETIHKGRSELVDHLSYSFAALCTIIEKNDFVKKELPLMISFAKNHNKEVRMTCVQILSLLIKFFEPTVWYRQLYEMISALASDQLSTIRSKLPQLVALYAKRLTEAQPRSQLTARYILFCRDSTSTVRQSAAEYILTLAEALDQNERFITILPEVNLLLVDPVEPVRTAASKNLGQIITLIGKRADAQIISKYCSLLFSRDNTISFLAAYAFSGVALSLGTRRWNELEAAYDIACSSKFPNVRRTLSYGLIAFAHLLDPNQLVTIASSFLRDFPVVAIGVVSNLHQILTLIEGKDLVAGKESLLFALQDPCTKYKSWRMRLQVSEQLRFCSKFYDTEILFESAKELVRDEVWAVRKDAVISFCHLLTKDRIHYVSTLAEDEMYWIRATAAKIIGAADIELAKLMINDLVKLMMDPVPNVRISAVTAANFIVASLGPEDSSINDELQGLLQDLRNDSDNDVSTLAYNLDV